MIRRSIEKEIRGFYDYEKAIIITGARQVGKTTLIKSLLDNINHVLWIDGDDPHTRKIWDNISKETIKQFIADHTYIVIDEAQRILNVGLAIKMILDLKLNKQVIISGSSSLELNASINESLTGRKWSFELFPLSWDEISKHYGLMNSIQNLEQLLIFGSYPEIYTAKNKKKRRLQELSISYLFKDILSIGKIRKPELLTSLLEALAYQVGNEVSYHELANMLKVDHETIQKYIGLLEDSYVIYRLAPLSTNPRKEISTSRKIFFYDNGIRNAIINNFNPINARNDIGALWENFIITEVIKKHKYNATNAKYYFWRNKSGSEIDLITNISETFKAYELKYNPKKKVRFTPSFIERYQPIQTEVINSENFYTVLNEIFNNPG